MKQIKTLIIAAITLSFYSCSDDFLNTKNLYTKGFDNYYKSSTDINEAMAGVYNALYVTSITSNEHVVANLLSDLMLAGGGPDDKIAKYIDGFTDPDDNTYTSLWVETYNGVYRANAIIEAMTKNDYTSFFKTPEEGTLFKDQALGEAYFMRAFFMFRAAKFFGGIPIIPTTLSPRDVPRASIEETYSQIAADLKKSIELMPAINASTLPTERYGHANKWVAQAYLARVYLFYTGYMTNIEKQATTTLPLPEGQSIDKSYVVAQLNDCIAQSGYSLLSDFRNLWPYSYVNKSAGSVVLPWAEAEKLSWAGQDGFKPKFGTGNTEVMFATRYAFGIWGAPKANHYSNQASLYFGIRSNSMVPFGEGWGWGTIHPTFVSQWDDTDLRKKGSVLTMGDAEQGTGSYENNKGDHETGYFNKKYTSLQHNGKDGVAGMFYYLYSSSTKDLILWHAQDFYMLRFADVLLMHSELTETSNGMNQVRRRAGLADIPYSLDALKKERMYEFAFEGIRWFDLVRWGDVSNPAKNYYMQEVNVNNMGVPAKYSISYRPETKALVSIPESEIRLSNEKYKQNPGW